MPYRLLLTPRNPSHHPFHTDAIPTLAEAMRTQITVLATGDLESARIEFDTEDADDGWIRVVTSNEHRLPPAARLTDREVLSLFAAAHQAADTVDTLNESWRHGAPPHVEHIKIDETATAPFTPAELRALPERIVWIIEQLTAKVPTNAANQKQPGRRNRKRGEDPAKTEQKGVPR